MKPLKYLMIHCTATFPSLLGGVEWIKKIHLKQYGWSRVGYRSVITREFKETDDPTSLIKGMVKANLNSIVEDDEMTFGAAQLNPYSHHICLFGGLGKNKNGAVSPENNFTEKQFKALEYILRFYIDNVEGDWKICGHNQFHRKACPSFWVPHFCEHIGIEKDRIYQEDPYETKQWFSRINKLSKKDFFKYEK